MNNYSEADFIDKPPLFITPKNDKRMRSFSVSPGKRAYSIMMSEMAKET
jgi:hypothetical protein